MALGTLKLGGGVSGLQCSGRRKSSRSEVWEGKVQNGSGRSGSPALPVAGVKAKTREVRSPGLSLFNLTRSNHNLDSGHSGGQKCPPAAMESSGQAKNLELDFSTQWIQTPG